MSIIHDQIGKHITPDTEGIAAPATVALLLPDHGKRGPLKTSGNLRAVISHKGWRCRFNLMTAMPELMDADGIRVGRNEAEQRSMLVDACQKADVPDASIDEHLSTLGASYHPVSDWLDGGKWDGVKRVSEVIKTLNAADPEYAEAIMRPWLVAAVAAVHKHKDFKCKLIPVLQGDQSYRKSAWIHRLASVVDGAAGSGELNPHEKDSVTKACSHWIYELAELESTTKKESGPLKSFITQSEDKYRLPYGRTITTKKRQTVFFGTVNGTDFLKDQTGNARFAVIEMAARADMDKLNELLGWEWSDGRLELRDPELLRQFWLEVKHAYDAGASWHLSDDVAKLAAAANDLHTDKGSHYSMIFEQHLARPMRSKRWYTSSELCARHGERPAMCRQYGKALALLVREGRIESRELRGRRTEYLLPVNEEPEARDD